MNKSFFSASQIERFSKGESHFFLRHDLAINLKETPLASLFAPGFFAPVAKQLHVHDIIRIRSTDGVVDFDVTVKAIKGETVVIALRPRISQTIIDIAEAAERGPVAVKPLAIAAA
jgi:hypothetical protein